MKRTPEQEAFIKEIREGNSSINLCAVAGSGKTTTIIMALEECNIPPQDILLLAFNKKIQEELAKRAPKGVNVLTLNGLGHRAWGKHIGKKLFLNAKKTGGIVSELCRDSNDRTRHEYLQSLWGDIKDLVSKAKAVGLLPSQFAHGKGIVPDTEDEWKRLAELHSIEFNQDIFRLARKALALSVTKALAGEIDFDDQLYMPTCFRSNLDKYKLVLVDEAQDLSEIQHFLISRAVAPGGRLVAVGDPNQAIYGFRGALSDSMEALATRFNSKELTLSYTFRCSKSATELAQRIVPQIKAAEGNLDGYTRNLQLNWSPEDIDEGSAVLCRNIAPLVRLGMTCIKKGIPAYVAGRDIGAPMIKAVKTLGTGDIKDEIESWYERSIDHAKGNLELISKADDTREALLAVLGVSGCTTKDQLVTALQTLFSKSSGSIVLSTIHRAKGLEWDKVYILDSWRIPQKWIMKAVTASPSASWMLDQEDNLYYIAVTRTKDELTFINYPEN